MLGWDWGQEEKGVTEDEMVGYHHWLNGHEFEQTPGDSEGQGSLACCSPWIAKSQLDTTEWLNNKPTSKEQGLCFTCGKWPVICFITYGIPASRVIKLSVNTDKFGDIKERGGVESDGFWFLNLGNKLIRLWVQKLKPKTNKEKNYSGHININYKSKGFTNLQTEVNF